MRTRLRYPEGIFALQAAMYATYHMTNPAVFYNKEDLWEVPTIGRQASAAGHAAVLHDHEAAGRTGAGVHSDAALHAGAQGQPRLVDGRAQRRRALRPPAGLPASRSRRWCSDHGRSWRGSIRTRRSRPQITLWNQQGSEVLHGTLLVIPIEESLLYIRPLYLRSAGGRIPELKRVIVAHQNQIVMEETLEKALERLFPDGGGGGTPAPPAAEPGTGIASLQPQNAELLASAREHYRRALQAQREGNWALYGEEIRRLGEVLNQMSK